MLLEINVQTIIIAVICVDCIENIRAYLINESPINWDVLTFHRWSLTCALPFLSVKMIMLL